jgi:hypothetical protein
MSILIFFSELRFVFQPISLVSSLTFSNIFSVVFLESLFELEGYNNFEDNVCTPIGCPEGFRGMDDEDNICHSNEKDCPNNMVLADREYESESNTG